MRLIADPLGGETWTSLHSSRRLPKYRLRLRDSSASSWLSLSGTVDSRPSTLCTIRLIVICSVAPVFYAVLPLVLNALGLSGTTLWRLSSIMIGLAGVAITLYLMRQLSSLAPGEGRKLNYGFVLGIIASLSCFANALGWPYEPAGGLYLLTVWSIVGIAGGNSVELLFRRLL